MDQYPAAGVIMALPVKPGHELFTKEKLEGYRSACRLLSSLAETSGNVSDEEMRGVHIERHKFHGEWNYAIMPQPKP